MQIGAVAYSHAVERSGQWGRFVHHLSEQLILVRGNQLRDGTPAFGNEFVEVRGLDIHRHHHDSKRALARQIEREYDAADEFIHRGAALDEAYRTPTTPSAHDPIFVPNFLTNPGMLDDLAMEIQNLAKSLTPGGVLLFLTASGRTYEPIRDQVRNIAVAQVLSLFCCRID